MTKNTTSFPTVADQDLRYAILVRAPSVGLAPFVRGDWVMMGIVDGAPAASHRFNQVKSYLNDLEGGCIVLHFPRTNIGEVRVAGVFRADKIPALADVIKATKSTQQIFWQRVGLSVTRASGEMAKPYHKTASRKTSPALWRLARVLVVSGMMAALVPIGIAVADVYREISERVTAQQSEVRVAGNVSR